jgi:hypothetical protein
MRSLKRLLAAVGTIVALTVLAPAAAAGSHHDFNLDKTCAEDPSEPLGYICTVQHSDFKWLPPGTDIHYTGQNPTGDIVDATITITNGSTNGVCVWSSAVTAVCTFSPGTGRLAQFHLEVDVTANADQSIWYWNGAYWYGN